MVDFLSPMDCWLDIDLDLCTPTLQKTYHIIIISILEFQKVNILEMSLQKASAWISAICKVCKSTKKIEVKL